MTAEENPRDLARKIGQMSPVPVRNAEGIHAVAELVNAWELECAQLAGEMGFAARHHVWWPHVEQLRAVLPSGIARCNPIVGVHASPHVGCILR